MKLLDQVATSSSRSDAQLDSLSSLLTLWSQNLAEKSKQAFHQCWFELLKKIIDFGRFDLNTRLLMEQQVSQYLTTEDGMKLITCFEHIQPRKELYRFGLLFSSHKEVVIATVQRMKEPFRTLISKAALIAPFAYSLFAFQNFNKDTPLVFPVYDSDYDISLLSIILKSNLLVEFIDTPYYQLLIDLVLHCNGILKHDTIFNITNKDHLNQIQKELESIDKTDLVYSIPYTVALLSQHLYFIHAAFLTLQALNVHNSFHTVNVGLAILSQYLEQQIEELSSSFDEIENNVRATEHSQAIYSLQTKAVTRERCKEACIKALNIIKRNTK
jgi:hypothetical protein